MDFKYHAKAFARSIPFQDANEQALNAPIPAEIKTTTAKGSDFEIFLFNLM